MSQIRGSIRGATAAPLHGLATRREDDTDEPKDSSSRPRSRPASCRRPCPICSAMTRRPSSSNTAAMPWAQEHLARDFARDIVLLEQTAINPVVVHGGGPQIEAMLKKVGVQSQYRGRAAHHRREDAGNRRNGAGRTPSTSRWSATSTKPAARRSGCAARTATWWSRAS